MLKKYVTDEVISKTESDCTFFPQPSNKKPSQYVEELVTETLRCGKVYQEYTLKEIIKGLDALVCHSMREYWGNEKDPNLHDLAFHTTLSL